MDGNLQRRLGERKASQSAFMITGVIKCNMVMKPCTIYCSVVVVGTYIIHRGVQFRVSLFSGRLSLLACSGHPATREDFPNHFFTPIKEPSLIAPAGIRLVTTHFSETFVFVTSGRSCTY